jgi:ketosteroid isomerase-like protein
MTGSEGAARSGVAEELVALEAAALARWCSGDPSGFLELCAEDVTYFDPFLARRIDGLAALTDYYRPLRGTISAPHHQLLHPRVVAAGELAVLSFQFVSANAAGGDQQRWNCTEAYRRDGGRWRIVQTHWSFTEGGLARGAAGR